MAGEHLTRDEITELIGDPAQLRREMAPYRRSSRSVSERERHSFGMERSAERSFGTLMTRRSSARDAGRVPARPATPSSRLEFHVGVREAYIDE